MLKYNLTSDLIDFIGFYEVKLLAVQKYGYLM